MLDGVYDDVDLCSGTERVFWKIAWKYFQDKNVVSVLSTNDKSLSFSEDIYKCSLDTIVLPVKYLKKEWNETIEYYNEGIFKNRTIEGMIFATEMASYTEIRIKLIAEIDQTSKFLMILTDTDPKQVESILKLCWHKYNMLNVAIFYNFDKLSNEYNIGMNESFTLSFYDPFVLINDGTERGLVHEFRMEDNDSLVQEIVKMMNRRLKDVKHYPLRICMVESNGTATPIYHPNGTFYRYWGRDGSMMQNLAKTMNFYPIYHHPADDKDVGKIYKNGTMTGCLADVEKGQTDIVGNMCPILDLGQKNSEFVTPIEDINFAFITPNNPPRFVVTFFSIYSIKFYMLWSGVYVLVLCTWLYIQKLLVFLRAPGIQRQYSFIEIFLLTFGNSMNVSQPVIKPGYARFLFITWALLSMINGFIYAATMVEHLTGGRVSMNLQRMRNLKDNDMKILVHHRFKDIIKDMAESDAAPDYYKDLYKRQIVVNTTEEALERIAESKDAVLFTTLVLAHVFKMHSVHKEDLNVLNSGPPNRYSSNLVPNSSPYKPSFDEIYMRIKEFGLMPKWSNDVLDYAMRKNEEDAKDHGVSDV
ncbi:uncharacterized protein LOC113391295 [Ctenocephalides felis]|uniref:uncharacterized protein LOC113391295 n=1 Tax=Ctenocephalides felis TaxID=7515 RepID=UPI000E6E4D28|nr:uncharacterized protein LOC113391295 [Ctenocephalides felis]